MSPRRIVIVGAGPAGLATAPAYREHGGTAEVTLLGKETLIPYQRPPLTKEFLRGELDASELPIQSRDWFDEHDIQLSLGCEATAIDPHTGIVNVDGAEPQRPSLPGLDDLQVQTMRERPDSERIASQARPGTRAVVLGTGFIGCELAGRVLAGDESAHWQEVPGFWSTIGEHTIKYAAWGDGYDSSRLEEHPGGMFTVWYSLDGKLGGVLTHERDEDYEQGRNLIQAGESPP
ncbi:MAG TPA: FAD-dependent oxidoreductase [Solirubrobacteraceae bacterium]